MNQEAPEIAAAAAMLRHQLQGLPVQMPRQIKGRNAQVQLELCAVQHVLPEVECVHVGWTELPAPSALCVREHAPPLGRWQRTTPCTRRPRVNALYATEPRHSDQGICMQQS